jgi:type II secretory pathway component GspD/PulD (secretin)
MPFYLRSGHALIIGGLTSKRDDRQHEKIPFLGSLPFIGKNFGRNTKTLDNQELVLVIKATIVSDRDLLQE